MAPTELLAQQHFQVLTGLLQASRVRMELLVGSRPESQRRDIINRLQGGDLDLVVGTHALAHERVGFAKLGLVIVDEQHKFGVQHRAGLRQSSAAPHYLVMTATPIPRTVALVQFGDLDVSTIDDLPPGRQAVHTYVPTEEQRDAWWKFFARKLAEGRQGYVVSPFVDQTSEGDLRGAEQLLEELASGHLEAFRLGLIHGRVPRAEQQATLAQFRQGKLQVLVATSLIEVGIDVPNATVMTVEHAERFGLAQLHQLRGRISRGVVPGFMCLIPSNLEDAALRHRLERFVATRSGFEVAELDLQLRGAGELLGLRQHGATRLRAADLERDQALLEQARQDALMLLSRHPRLDQPEFALLRDRLWQRYGSTLHLADLA
jgi:ATP-dependent DNA helicase RecG